MKNKSIFKYVRGGIVAVGMLSAIACTNGLETNLANPSTLTPEQADNEFLFNGMQMNLQNFFLNSTDFGQDLTRMRNLFGSTYENAYTQNSFNGVWTSAYSDLMVNANLLFKKTTEDPATTTTEYNPYYQGVGRIMKAYAMMTLVDFFGDVPYLEAFDTENFNPANQGGAAVYDSAKLLLDRAIVELNAVVGTTPRPVNDLFFNQSIQMTKLSATERTDNGTITLALADRWKKVATTLLLKWHISHRLVDGPAAKTAIAALVAAFPNYLIDDGAVPYSEDFQFNYSANSQSNPNSYHPWFYGNYLTSTGPYMSNSYMKELYDGKTPYGYSGKDPRIRYYFYRQVNAPTTEVNELTCSSTVFPYTAIPPAHYPPGTAYCQLPEGYWGRDHLNFEGTPPDGLKKTTYGIYPAGGRFDANDAKTVTDQKLASGARGQGILPFMMSSYVQFMLAEYELTLNLDAAAARVRLNAAVRQSIDRVKTFSPAVNASFVPSAAGIDNYVNAVLAHYDAPGADQLDVIAKEYWIALWGNGIEAYNLYRRTGRPLNQQPALAVNPGDFYRSLTYPAVYVVRNSSAVQKPDNKVQVFWDKNPAGFIK